MDDFLFLAKFIAMFVIWAILVAVPEVIGGLLDGSIKRQHDAEIEERQARLKAMTDLADEAIAARSANKPLPTRTDQHR